MSGSVVPLTKGGKLLLDDPRPIPNKAPNKRQALDFPAYDRRQSHPGTGLEPERVWHIFRAAEHGHLECQADLFDDIVESDGHLRSLIEGRIVAVAGKDWVIQPGGSDPASIKAAEALEEALTDGLDFVELLEHQLTAPYYGFACSEIIWGLRDNLVAPTRFIDVPHRRFRIGEKGDLRLVTKNERYNGEELKAGKWIISKARHASLARAGLLRTAAWWALFKRMSVRDWVVYAEKFGLPYITGRYQQSASDESKAVLAQVVEDLGSDGYAVLSDEVDVAIHDIGTRMGDDAVHPALIGLCEAQMSKLIYGATLTNDSGGSGSWALGKVHQGRSFALEQADASRFQHVFRKHISAPFVKYNNFGKARPPRLKIQISQELDPKTRAQVASILVNELGAEIDGKQLMDELGFRRPAIEDDTLRGAQPQKAPIDVEDE